MKKISALDEKLAQLYREALTNTADKEILKQQQIEWLKQQRACKDTSCLAQSYQERISQLQSNNMVVTNTSNSSVTTTTSHDAPTKPSAGSQIDGSRKNNFKLTESNDDALCEEYLKVLNRTKWDDLLACKLPDLTGSSIQPVPFKLLTGDALKTIDKIIYEQSGGKPKPDWTQAWPEREKEYAMGYRALGEAYWDLDGDGELDQIIEEQYPASNCDIIEDGDFYKNSIENQKKWEVMGVGEKLNHAKNYILILKGKVIYVDAQNFTVYKNKHVSINHGFIVNKNIKASWGKDSSWIYISGMRQEKENKYNEYRMSPAICNYRFFKN